MLLGAAVIVIVGFLVINYFKNIGDTGTTLPAGGSTTEQSEVKLPAKHTVVAGETLWSIAEKYFKSGYNWVDIQKANNLTDAAIITKGQILNIPDVAAREVTSKDIASATTQPSSTPVVTATPMAISTTTPEATMTATTKGGQTISKGTTTTVAEFDGNTYTVAHGDNLWKIAVKAYGDGHKWTEISKANKLAHPSVIHAGNVLQIPR